MLGRPELPPKHEGLSKNRLEALTDGVYAIAITLLVFELKVPEPGQVRTDADLVKALWALAPKFTSWVISFLVLAIFWVANHRLFQWVRSVDVKLLWISLFSLLAATFVPFASALVGEFPAALASQALYAADMAALGLIANWQLSHFVKHPELCHSPLPHSVVRGARMRSWGTIAIAVFVVVIVVFDLWFGTIAFTLMLFIS